MDIPYGICCDIGMRNRMEDEYAIYSRPKKGFFSAEVYDGHGGASAAVIAAEMFTPYFLHLWSEELNKEPHRRRPIHEIIRETCREVDRFIVERVISCGTTLANFYIIKDRFYSINIGDSRIAIGTKDGAVFLTEDHKPHFPKERRRIESLGGYVIKFGVYRVQGDLAMSRALGDGHLKPYVIAEPFILEGLFGRENDYVIVACDGVWDVMDAEEAMKITRKCHDAQKAADTIISVATDYGSADNKTVIVLDLRRYTEGVKGERMEILKKIDMAI
ncbi:MAG TPA: PP2C family protein-serine/threonine phosphatase [Syntrophorhabdaceae bacterium]|nr:PP2C family protein-serine/threonine phosphatase [Syntrophorhabdaceae bacterium]